MATLRPVDPVGVGEPIVRTCLICGSRGLADALLNLVLFAPLGAVLAVGGWSVVRVGIAAFVLSVGIETTQIGLVGRFGVLGDVVWNTAGAILGAALVGGRAAVAAWIIRHRRPIGTVLLLLPFATWMAASVLLVPAPRQGTWYGQWTADLGLAVYDGRILEAAIGDQAAPSWRLSDSDRARRDLMSGEPITLRFVAGAPPDRLAPVFSVYDERRQEVLLLGADGQDLVLRIRTRSELLRLDRPDFRWHDGMRGRAPGDTIALALARGGPRSFCIRWPQRTECVRLPAWRGWTLLLAPRAFPPGIRWLVDLLWVGAGVACLGLGAWLAFGAAARHARRSV